MGRETERSTGTGLFVSGPGAYPWQAHTRGLIAHVVLGVVTESALKLFDRMG